MKRIPLVRILVPYLAGISGLLCGLVVPWLHLLFSLFLLLLCLAFLVRRFGKSPVAYVNTVFAGSLYGLLFLLAFETAIIYDDRTGSDHYTHYLDPGQQQVLATVADIPVAGEKSIKLNVLVDAINENDVWHTASGKLLVYVQQPLQTPLHAGDQILMRTHLSVVPPPQNPLEVNYRQVLERKNIFHTAYLQASDIWLTGYAARASGLQRLGVSIRQQVVTALRHSGLSQEAFSICTALLVGYDDEISSGVMQSFSHAGTLHILSVSGMHTGMLYMVLMFFFDRVDPHRRYAIARALVMITALLLFSAITGFSPSVSRASLMLVLVLLGKTFRRHGSTYNTLLFSAFLLLLYNPYLLADVGFLLSYLAVFGIIYLYPVLNGYWTPKNRILKFFWDINLMSISATVFTLPITLYYFHQFPLWFMLSNLLIIPLSTALMGVSILLLLCHGIPLLQPAFRWLADAITGLMLRSAQLTDNPVYGYADGIAFDGKDILFCSALILSLLWFLASKRYRALAVFLLAGIAWLSASAISLVRSSSEAQLVVFSIRHKAAYLVRNGRQVFLQADSLSASEFNRSIKPYLLSIPGVQWQYGQARAWQLEKARITNTSKPSEGFRPACDYLIVSHNTWPDPAALQQIRPLVIVDCSNSYTFVKKLRKQCTALGLSFYAIKEQGALVISL